MKKDFMGINTDSAEKALEQIKEKKKELIKESKEATISLKKHVNKVFKDNDDREKMLEYIEEINNTLEELYGYLDGNKYSFASKLNEFIQSYIISDENVKKSYIEMLKTKN